MRTLTDLLLLGASTCLCTVALGQDEPQPYIYTTYHDSVFDDQEKADEIVDSAYKPIYDAAVADGTIVCGSHDDCIWEIRYENP